MDSMIKHSFMHTDYLIARNTIPIPALSITLFTGIIKSSIITSIVQAYLFCQLHSCLRSVETSSFLSKLH